jgi:hypothetical protein
MKINQIIVETATTSGVVATISKPLGEVQKRPEVAGLKPINQLGGNKKGPYANSLTEGAMKQLSQDLKELKDEEFKKKYGKTKQEARKALTAKPEPVQEAKLDEEDIIIVPGRGAKRKTGFVTRGQSRVDHEVEMARSDVLATIKNAKAIYTLLQNRSEEEGLEGWVQEKLIKANDYLNAVREYYDEKMVDEMSGAGVIAGGPQYEGKEDKIAQLKKDHDTAVHWSKNETSPQKREAARQKAEKIKRHLDTQYKQGVAEDKGMTQYNAFKREWRAKHGADAKVPGYDSKEYTSYCYRQNDKKQGVAEDTDIGAIQALTDETLTKYLKAFKTRYGAGDDSKAVKDAIIALRNEAKRRDSAGSVEGVAEDDAGDVEQRMLIKIEKEKQRLAQLKKTDPEAYQREMAKRKQTNRMPAVSTFEGAKVDRMVKHVAQSEKKLGHSKKEAENIAWATANKRGMLDNKNKKKVK